MPQTLTKRTLAGFLALALGVTGLSLFDGTALAQRGAGVVGPPVEVPGIDKPVRVIRGRFSSNVTLENAYHYVLRGAVFFQAGTTLTIQPGTRIVGEFATLGTLVIDQGAQIIANGTREQPIVFTSDQPIGARARGDWGGLVINGRAPINTPGGIGFGEGDTGPYGGTDPDDNSGILRFVRVEYGGIEFSPDNELNGITFHGVGRGTSVEYIQALMCKDDCLEWFGGTVDARYVLAVGSGDDTFDWTFGWSGRGQFWIVQQRGDDADNGFEIDNNGGNNDLEPRSNATLYNLTLVGDPLTDLGDQSDDGMIVREGTAGTFRNFIVMGFREWGINIDHGATVRQAELGNLTFGNGILFNNGLQRGRGHLDPDAARFIANNPTILIGRDPGLIDPYNREVPNFRPAGAATLAGGQLAPAIPPNDGFFQAVPFIGALGPDPEEDWTTGWTTWVTR